MYNMSTIGSDNQIWQSALIILSKQVNPTFYQWLSSSRLISTHSNDKYILHVNGNGAKEQLEKRCLLYIENAVTEVIGAKKGIHVKIIAAATNKNRHQQPDSASAPLFSDVTSSADTTPTPPLSDILPKRHPKTTPQEHRGAIQNRSGSKIYNSIQKPGAAQTSLKTEQAERNNQEMYPGSSGVLPDIQQRINPRYTFDNFIVGSGNRFAYAASQAVSEKPGEAYNPLFLYGGVGLGKTHLMYAIANFLIPKGAKILYVTSEDFTNEIVNAIRYRNTENFRAKYRSVDVLLVDDIQFIAGKDSTEEEFFNTFNTLYGAGKQIVMCSDRPPKAIELEERLRSRFEWGLTADIQPPDMETRHAILCAKAEALNENIHDSVLTYLAERVQTNVRELEGTLNRVVAFAKLHGVPITSDIARQALNSLGSADQPQRRITVGEVLAAVSKYYHISIEDLRGKQRDKHIVMPRQIAMWMMRQDTKASLLEIGQELGGRDHSTILHGCDKIEKELRDETSRLRDEIVAIRGLTHS